MRFQPLCHTKTLKRSSSCRFKSSLISGHFQGLPIPPQATLGQIYKICQIQATRVTFFFKFLASGLPWYSLFYQMLHSSTTFKISILTCPAMLKSLSPSINFGHRPMDCPNGDGNVWNRLIL